MHNANDLSAAPVNFAKQNSIIKNLCFDARGEALYATNDLNKMLCFNTAKPGETPANFCVHPKEITSMAQAKNGFYTSCADGYIRQVNTGTHTFGNAVLLPSQPLCLAYNDQLQILVTGCENGMVYKLQAGLQGIEDSIYLGSEHITAIAFVPGTHKIVAGSTSGMLIVKDLAKAKDPTERIKAHTAGITQVSISPDGRFLVSSSFDDTVMLYRMDYLDERPLKIADHVSWVYGAVVNAQGTRLASAGKDKSVRLYTIGDELINDEIKAAVKRNLTPKEWISYVGSDIPYMP